MRVRFLPGGHFLNPIFSCFIHSNHMRECVCERGKTLNVIIKEALDNPTKIEYDKKRRVLFKKLYHSNGKERRLLIVGERRGDVTEIITIIDTTKVKKYL